MRKLEILTHKMHNFNTKMKGLHQKKIGGIDGILSSLSIILSDVEEGMTSDNLRKLALYYSKKFFKCRKNYCQLL